MQYFITTKDRGTVDWLGHTEVLRDEARHIWKLYKNGLIRNIWFSEKKDALLIIECENIEQARILLEDFPLVKANLIEYQITTLLPYVGFDRLIN